MACVRFLIITTCLISLGGNLFIQELMLKAPGDFVPVYLYAQAVLLQRLRRNSIDSLPVPLIWSRRNEKSFSLLGKAGNP